MGTNYFYKNVEEKRCYTFSIFSVNLIFIIVGVILLRLLQSPPELTPVIQTTHGQVQGIIRYSRSGHEFWQFLGIPYAKPPTGKRKFLPPLPAKPWKGIKLVDKYTKECVQFSALLNLKVSGSFDCLYLNVFVHKGMNSTSSLKPVIVFIYGGGFVSGATRMFQPDYFMDHDLVLVNMNYRLGPYGFLNLGEKQGPRGNMALFDQLLVLKWVQANIANFGGNPENVGIMGSSAGGVMVHCHLLSPLSRGLFSKAIMQSGSLLAPWAFSPNHKHVAMEYAKRLGCQVDNSSALRYCYETTPYKKLVGNQRTLVDPLEYTDLFVPTVDGKFLTDTPVNLLKAQKFSKVPLMLGINSAEGVFGPSKFDGRPHLVQKLENNWTSLLGNIIMLEKPLDEDVAKKIRQEYFGTASNFVKDEQNFVKNLTALGCDAAFWNPVHKAASLHAQSGAPTYLYFYNYTSKIFPGSYTLLRLTTSDDFLWPEVGIALTVGIDWIKEFILGDPVTHKYGAGHSDDLLMQWNFEGFSKYLAKLDKRFSRKMVQAIVDFVSGNDTLILNGKDWPAADVKGKRLPYVVLDDTSKLSVVLDPVGKRRQFWNKLENYLVQTKRDPFLY